MHIYDIQILLPVPFFMQGLNLLTENLSEINLFILLYILYNLGRQKLIFCKYLYLTSLDGKCYNKTLLQYVT